MEAGEDNKSACVEVEKKNVEKVEENIDKINYSVDVEKKAPSVTTINEFTITETISTTEWKNTSNNSENVIKKQEGQSKNSKKKNKDAAIFKKKFGMSDSDLVNKKSNSSGFAKILQWDPWHKIRRNKKDKHKKFNKKNEFTQKVEGSSLSSFDMKSIEESVYEIVPLHPKDEYEAMFNPKKYCKTEKNVRFQSDVTVVLFENNQILGETVEPLKKELEQQERNKELRKEVCPEGYNKGGNWKKTNVYMSSWYIRRK